MCLGDLARLQDKIYANTAWLVELNIESFFTRRLRLLSDLLCEFVQKKSGP